jgi:hypothetical protein
MKTRSPDLSLKLGALPYLSERNEAERPSESLKALLTHKGRINPGLLVCNSEVGMESDAL